jgi:hypothetical protein
LLNAGRVFDPFNPNRAPIGRANLQCNKRKFPGLDAMS